MESSSVMSASMSNEKSDMVSHTIPRKPLPKTTVQSPKDDISYIATPMTSADEQLPQRLQKGHEVSVLRLWWLELTSAILTVAVLLAIVFILSEYRDKPTPRLPYHISINTILSILGTIMKACGLLLLAEGLSQLKWEYYKARHPLQHFAIFDAASRGPWGCIMLVSRLRSRALLPVLGALISILALVLEPFLQSLVSYYPCSVLVTNSSIALIPRANFYEEWQGDVASAVFDVGVAQKGAIVNGFFSPGNAQVQPDCPTGNCTFENVFASVGICSSCVDVTHELSFRTWNATNESYPYNEITATFLPSGANATVWTETFGYGSSEESRFFTITVGNASFDEIVFEIILARIWNGSEWDTHTWAETFAPYHGERWTDPCPLEAWRNDTWGCKGHGAARCTLRPCVNTYKASVNNGVLSETILDSHSNWTWGRPIQSYGVMADLDCVNASTRKVLNNLGFNTTRRFMPWNVLIGGYEPEPWETYGENIWPNSSTMLINLTADQRAFFPDSCIYQVSAPTTWGFTQFLEEYLTDYVQEAPRYSHHTTMRLAGGVEILTLLNDTMVSTDSISNTFDGIANAMTVRMRSYNTSYPASGNVNVTDTCLSVHWLWLIYPATVTLLAILFLLLMLVQTERASSEDGLARGWKSSQLPLLYRAVELGHKGDSSVEEGTTHYPVRHPDIKAMERAAKTDTVVIGDDADGLLSKEGEDMYSNAYVES